MVNTIDKSWIFHTFSSCSWKNLQRSFSASFRDENGGKHEWRRERERERGGGSVWKGRWQEDKGIPRATALERVWTITGMFERRAALMPKAYSRRSWWSGSSASSNGPSLSRHLNRMSTQASLRVTNLWEELPLSSLSINYRSWSDVSTVCLDFSFHLFFLSFFFGFVRKLRLEKWGVIFFSIRFRNLEIAEEETWKEMRRRHFQIEILN